MKIVFVHNWEGHRAGPRPVDFPEHIAKALCTSPGPDGEPYARPADDFQSMTVVQLRGELRSHDLPVSGSKAELLERLRGG